MTPEERENERLEFQAEAERLAEAEPLMRRALQIDERSYGPDHPTVATRLNNLAGLLYATNRLAEAEPLYRRALQIDERSYGPGHPEVARDLNNLALLLQATNRLAEAEPLMRRALQIDEHSYGPDHPTVARDLNNLALLLQATNRLAEAEPLSRRAVTLIHAFRRRTGHEHPHLEATLANHRRLLEALGRSKTAIQTELRRLQAEEP
jgi:tetratricopeptide (TPR) repeat protein